VRDYLSNHFRMVREDNDHLRRRLQERSEKLEHLEDDLKDYK